MNNKYIYLWAQWGILNFQQYQIIKQEFGDLKTAWEKINPEFLRKLGFNSEKISRIFEIRNLISITDILLIMERYNVQILSIDDENYPPLLKTISDPPPFLFITGVLPSFHKSLSVVGTRLMTEYGEFVTEKFVSRLVKNGFVIVSGLALGVDAYAHQITLNSNGITVAVLGSGVDRVYPATNQFLAKNILKNGGAIISEYPLGTPAMPHHFPERNRIVSGLSRGLLVAEGGVRSGALITARLALDQGREVFAVPHSITKVDLSGTNHLIRRGEAKLVEKIEHILEEFQFEPVQQQIIFDLTDQEKKILSILAVNGKTIDELSVKTSLSIVSLSEILMCLQLKGATRELGQKWILN